MEHSTADMQQISEQIAALSQQLAAAQEEQRKQNEMIGFKVSAAFKELYSLQLTELELIADSFSSVQSQIKSSITELSKLQQANSDMLDHEHAEQAKRISDLGEDLQSALMGAMDLFNDRCAVIQSSLSDSISQLAAAQGSDAEAEDERSTTMNSKISRAFEELYNMLLDNMDLINAHTVALKKDIAESFARYRTQ
ncbi:MAG: hypothetical protein IK130_09130 [Oscillospiraceae bacterium]|nr:hypothetical protein [Oscillospiraceae bacterium]